ncbi:sulfur carrier protein ThiS [uncultured Shewanella sp.]|uniref:sulfur carrier protein ThiS n=1 Tax=uncultured Shewanella sp. TaxID=173975 RepID=UPI002615C186|nr:sulfur carrier protein ThiS [uncultured Shewanella sp.]
MNEDHLVEEDTVLDSNQAGANPAVSNTVEQAVFFNDKAVNVAPDVTLLQLLQRFNIEPNSVAVVVNQGVVPRSLWQTQVCQHQDKIDVFTVVAGG